MIPYQVVSGPHPNPAGIEPAAPTSKWPQFQDNVHPVWLAAVRMCMSDHAIRYVFQLPGYFFTISWNLPPPGYVQQYIEVTATHWTLFSMITYPVV